MIRLVINGDDLGLHPRIDEGIFRAFSGGVLTSSTVLVTARYAEKAVERAVREGLPLGVHLCLTSHLPPAADPRDVRWVAPGGRFRKDWRELSLAWLSGILPREEVEQELKAQVERAIALGAKVDHIDTHQHLHLLPGLTGLVENVAAEFSLPMRWPREAPTAHWLAHPRSALKTAMIVGLSRLKPAGGVRRVLAHGVFESGRLTERRLLRLIEHLPDGDHEIVTHPGFAPGAVPEDPDWQYGWEDELNALLSDKVRQALKERQVELTSFGRL